MTSLTKLIRNAAFGLSMLISSACYDSSEDEDFNTGGENTPLISHHSQRTDQNGETTFQQEGRNVPVRVEDTRGNPLSGIVVHYAFKDDKNLILAVDPEERFVPDRHIFSGSVPAANVRRRAGLSNLISFSLDNTDALGTIVEAASTPHRGDLLEETEDVNRYCMNMEDILKTTIDVPAGLILLAPQVAGMDATLLRIAVGTILRDNVDAYIISRYGEQPGYEVWVPKKTISICGREYNDVICDLSEGQLERLWDTNLPYWRINGACTPRHIGEGEAEAEAEAEGEERCGGSPLVNRYAWEVYGCHAGTTELAGETCLVPFGSDVLHVDGNEFWVNSDTVGRFTRDVSASDLAGCSQGEIDLCAVNNDPELYLAPINGNFCSGAGIYRLTSVPWPGLDGCRSRERNQKWYSKCGHDVY